jgi:signal transduction histidine kinase
MLVDGVAAGALLVAGVASAVGLHRLFSLPFVLAMVVPVVFRRRHPVGAFAVAIVAGAMEMLINFRATPADLAIPILLYTLAAYRPRRISLPGLVIVLCGCAAAVARWFPSRLDTAQAFFAGSISLVAPTLIAWVLGDSMRWRRAFYRGLEERAAQLERERDAHAQVAAATERARIARELHDVVAHNVSVMVVQADGAGYALDAEPERARQALADISRTGRQALAEMRRLLGVLRSSGARAGVAPLPGIGQLGDLLAQARRAGLEVSMTVSGPPQAFPAGFDLAAYRVVQEALTNVRKHAGPAANAEVAVQYGKGELRLEITDNGRGAAAPSDGAGHGLTGMRERVEMYGGTLDVGARPGGGFRVAARIPVPPGPDLGPPLDQGRRPGPDQAQGPDQAPGRPATPGSRLAPDLRHAPGSDRAPDRSGVLTPGSAGD